MKRPRISLLHYSTPPVIGGVESVIASHERLFGKAGFPVRIITGEGGTADPGSELVRISEMSSSSPGLDKAMSSLPDDRGSLERVTDSIHRGLLKALEGVDICFAHNVFTMHFNLPLSWALRRIAAEKELPVKIVNWIHDMTVVNPDYIEEREKTGYPWDILRRNIENTRCAVISELRREQASSVYGIPRENITCVPNGVDLSSFLDLTPFVHDIFLKEELERQDIVAFTPTRILRRKNLEAGIHLTRALIDRGLRVKWLISGAPDPHNPRTLEYFRQIEDMVDANGLRENVISLSVRYGKQLTDDDIRSLYRLSDTLFFLSRQEGFGIPVLEAGLMSMLAVLSDLPTLKMLGGDSALYLSLEDPDYAAAAERVIDHTKKSERYRLHKRVIREFSWRSIFEKDILPFTESVAAGKA